MLNIKQIRLNENIVEARVEQWAPEDLSFDIKIDVKDKSILWCEIGEDVREYRMYAKKARNKLCDMVAESQEKGTSLPYYGYYVTH